MPKQITFDSLRQNLLKVVYLTDEELATIDSYFERIRVPRKTNVLNIGDDAQGFYYVVKGCVRAFAPGIQNDQNNILSIAIEDWWITNLDSWLNHEPSRYTIQAIENSELLFIPYDRYEELLERIPQLERYYRKITQKGLAVLQRRILDSLGKDATTRYLEFREKYGHLESRVPQHMIASYLGITPEFLSMIRNKLARGGVKKIASKVEP